VAAFDRLVAPIGVLLTMLGLALRRIDPLWVAAQIDKSHQLNDRLSSALQFAVGRSSLAPTETARGLAELAVQDAARVARDVKPAQAAPWQKPPLLPLLCGLIVLNGIAWVIRIERSKPQTAKATTGASEKAAATLQIDPELIGPEREELLQKLAEAEHRGDHEMAQRLREMLDLLKQVERSELTRQQAFDRLSEIEQRVREGSDATLAELQKRLRQAGSELTESKLTRELGKAMVKEDLDKAKAELKDLADRALAKAATADKQQMAEAFERAAKALSSRPDDKAKAEAADPSSQKDEWQAKNKTEELSQKLNALRDEERKLREQLDKNPKDAEAQRKLDEVLKKEQQLSEQLKQQQQELLDKQKEQQAQKEQLQKEQEQQMKELRDEERRLKKKLAENPQDEESERRLKKTQRQLEQLERQQQSGGSGERQLQRLGDEKQPEYQSEARKLMSEMEREQQKFEDEIRKLQAKKEQLEKDIRRLKEQLKKNPQDKQAQQELQAKQQQLSEVEKQLKEKQEAQQQMKQLQRDLQQAAERMRQSMEKMTPEQRQSMEELARDLSRYQDEVRKLAKQKQGQKQNIVTLDELKQLLRRLGRNGQGQGQSQGQKDMQDFKKRASGQGDGDGQTMVLGGGGQDGQSTIVLMPGQSQPGPGQSGQGQGQGGGDKGNQNGQGGPGQGPSGDRPGQSHDPNFLGDATQIESKRRLTRVYGKEGAGPTRSQTILGAAEKGFATESYRKVYGDYTAVSEQAMSKQRVPPGYRFYVKRYFQMIKPRGQ
jgi:ribosomal protein S15P/S13E